LRTLRDGRIFHREALEDLVRRLGQYRKRSETIDVGAFKELAGVSRKNAIPLLEHLDEERVTLRRGNERVILLAGDEPPCSD
jgi:selenocysteine-specific elongation factor